MAAWSPCEHMKVKLILPALSEAIGSNRRSIKYSLFPPLGLATIASFFSPDDTLELVDEHVEVLHCNDEPDLVVIQVYITSAYRAYAIADRYREKGIYVALGGLHVTALPDEATVHADTIFKGPAEETWPQFLRDFKGGHPQAVYSSRGKRSLIGTPPIRRDLIKRHLYLVPNSIVVSRGCPHHCDFCYKDAFYQDGRAFYTQAVDEALAEIERLPGRHLFFLDDHLFGNALFAQDLFEGMKGMDRLWQGAGTVQSILQPGLLEKAVESGLRSLFVGFETLNVENLRSQHKYHNLNRDYTEAIARLQSFGVMINGSFVFGMDEDDENVFARTVEWAVAHGIETATFHILTPYPGTALYQRWSAAGRMTSKNWDLFDTRHVVYKPAQLSAQALESGYWQAYRQFYRWEAIFQGAGAKTTTQRQMRHLLYAGGWKKFESFWNWIIRAEQVAKIRPLLEGVLGGWNYQNNKQEMVHLSSTASMR